MTMLLDAGVFIAIERGDRRAEFAVRDARLNGGPPRTHGGIIGQVWRGPRQVGIARLLSGIETVPLGLGLGRDAGRLLARAGTADVLDAALVALAEDGDEVWTSDPDDIAVLAHAAQVDLRILRV